MQLQRARRVVTAPIVDVTPGTWSPLLVADAAMRILILRGMVLRTIDVAGNDACEPLGDGDVVGRTDMMVRRSVLHHGPPLLPREFSWEAVTPVTLAVIDPTFMHQVRDWPAVRMEIWARTVARSQRTALLNGIMHIRSARERLRLTLLLLAESWGNNDAQGDGLVIPFALTHAVLGRLIGADRPTVTLALKDLRAAGFVDVRGDRQFVVRREPAP